MRFYVTDRTQIICERHTHATLIPYIIKYMWPMCGETLIALPRETVNVCVCVCLRVYDSGAHTQEQTIIILCWLLICINSRVARIASLFPQQLSRVCAPVLNVCHWRDRATNMRCTNAPHTHCDRRPRETLLRIKGCATLLRHASARSAALINMIINRYVVICMCAHDG